MPRAIDVAPGFDLVPGQTLKVRNHEFHPEPWQIRRIPVCAYLNTRRCLAHLHSQQAIVTGEAAATARNILASETLFRLGIACNLITQILFMWVALALYDLFKQVNRRHAVLMVGLIAIPLPIVLINELNAIVALVLMRGADFLSVFSIPERNALAMLSLDVHGEAFVVAEIFWGLWLFPLGLLVYRSHFVPRILGVLLVGKGCYFLAISFVSVLVPQHQSIVQRWTTPLHFGELIFMFWLLIMGAKPKQSGDQTLSASVVG